MIETWISISGFDNYQISDKGRVRSINRFIECSNGVIRCYQSKVLKGYLDKDGYLEVKLCNINGRKTKKIHRLVLEAFIGVCPQGLECLHLDHNPRNNALLNLRWDSHKNNELGKKYGSHGEKKVMRSDGAIFESVTAAARFINLSTTYIAACCRNTHQIAAGFTWRYI